MDKYTYKITELFEVTSRLDAFLFPISFALLELYIVLEYIISE